MRTSMIKQIVARTSGFRRARTAAAVSAAFAALAISQDASALDPVWPAEGSWVPVTAPWATGGVTDPAGDNTGTGPRDVVGDVTNPALYVYANNESLFFRMRVGGDPLQNPTDFTPFGWGCEIITTATPTPETQSYQFIAEVDGVANPDEVNLSIKTTSAANNPKSTADDPPIMTYSALAPEIGSPLIPAHARVTAATTTVGGGADYFIDFTVDITHLAANGVTPTTPMQFVCGSSNSAQALTADLLGPSGAVTLTDAMSDPYVCGLLGCTSCFTAAACGPTCTACSGATPACKPFVGCVECFVNGDCSGVAGKPFCDTANNTCRGCTADAECTATGATACNLTGPLVGQCTQCSQANQLACTGATPACLANGTCGCAVDSDCTATEFCDTVLATCAARLSNGTQIPTIAGHDPALTGTCTTEAGAAVCASGVCDTADNRCGYADLHGPCTQATLDDCRSGACSASGVCMPSSGCVVDADCPSASWCSAGACVPDLTSGTAIPSVSGHTPVLDGTCTTAVGAAVCASGVCDETDDACGYASGNGTCTAVTAASVCRSQKCAETGPSAGKCVACIADGDCSGADPFCKADGLCGKCTTNADCDGNASGSFCDTTSGACTMHCNSDSDCGSASSGRICEGTPKVCIDGCRGTGGNACAAGQECTSKDASAGTCKAVVADAGPDAAPDAEAGAPEAGKDAGVDAQAEASVDASPEAGPQPSADVGEALEGGGLSCATRNRNGGGLASVLMALGGLLVARSRRRSGTRN